MTAHGPARDERDSHDAAADHGASPLDERSSPLDVARAVFRALNQRRWADAAQLVDAEDVDAWFQERLATTQGALEPTLEDVLRSDPDMSRAAAEYRLEQLRLTTQLYTGLGNDFVDISTREQLAQLAPAEALAHFLRARDPSSRFEAHIQRFDSGRVIDCPEPPIRQRTAVGVVEATEQAATVSYRLHWSDVTADDPSAETRVATLRRSPRGWRLRLAGEFVDDGAFTVLAGGEAQMQIDSSA